MLNKATSIILIITTSVSLVGYALPAYIWYLADYDYIVTYMCVNRDKPQMHCNGKCQLTKMIHKEQRHNKQKPAAPTAQKHKIDLFVTKLVTPLKAPARISISSRRYTNQMETLCFFEPASPPPKIS